jgi:hypothetical protein
MKRGKCEKIQKGNWKKGQNACQYGKIEPLP